MIGTVILFAILLYAILYLFMKGCSNKYDIKQNDEEQLKWIQEYKKDNGNIKNKYNEDNSTLMVQCNANKECDWRFSTMCKNCKHNCGKKLDRSSYEEE